MAKASHLCIKCNKEFYAYKYRKRKYCSMQCVYKNQKGTIQVTCKHCGKEFEAYKSSNRKFCSSKCSAVGQRIKITKGTKQCSKCKQQLSVSKFYGNNNVCRKCCSKREKNSKLIKSYGITLDEYNDMLAKQNGVCKNCGKKECRILHSKKVLLSVDHNHQTGKVRGLLCSKCNTAKNYDKHITDGEL